MATSTATHWQELQSSTSVSSRIHTIPVVTVGGNTGEGGKAPEGDAITALGVDPSETQLMMAQRRERQKRKTSNSVTTVRFIYD